MIINYMNSDIKQQRLRVERIKIEVLELPGYIKLYRLEN